jgi:hypothetical protein
VRRHNEFIIEHPRRGTLRSLEHDFNGDVKARFSTSGMRDDPEKTAIFPTASDAWLALRQIPTPTRHECKILVYIPEDVSYYKLEKT